MPMEIIRETIFDMFNNSQHFLQKLPHFLIELFFSYFFIFLFIFNYSA